jgi:hypothetical protein
VSAEPFYRRFRCRGIQTSPTILMLRAMAREFLRRVVRKNSNTAVIVILDYTVVMLILRYSIRDSRYGRNMDEEAHSSKGDQVPGSASWVAIQMQQSKLS